MVESLIPYLIIIPLGSAFLMPLFAKRFKGVGTVMACTAVLFLFVISCILIPAVLKKGSLVYTVGARPVPFGISLVVDGLSGLLLATISLVAFLVAVFSSEYMNKYTDKWKFYTLFSLMLAGINGVLITGDIFNLYIFLEIAAVSGYLLVAFGTEAESLEAAFKYAVMGTVASIFILLGIAMLYSYTSTFNMAHMACVLTAGGSSSILLFVSVLFIMGFSLKAALVPFHAWLPYAYSAAPAPVSAVLSGISTKVLGVYVLARILFNVFGMTPCLSAILVTLAIASMVIASILAFGQTDLKRVFAYSSISQVGYIALGLGVATPLSILGALLHFFNHSIFKSLLFLNSGSIEDKTGGRDIRDISAITSTLPVVGYTSLAGTLSICGLPPFGGFWSKLVIIIACVQAGKPVLAFTAAVVSMLTLAYYFRAMTPVLFGNAAVKKTAEKFKIAIAMPIVILAILSISSGAMLLPNIGNDILRAASQALVSGKDYAATILEVYR